MPKASEKTSMKLRKRSRPAYNKYNLRSKPRGIAKPCKICEVGSVNGCCEDSKVVSSKRRPMRREQKQQRTLSCVICLDTVKNKRTRKVKCGHAFHAQCINMWLKQSDSCPVCRFQLRKPVRYIPRVPRMQLPPRPPFLQFHFF